MKASLKLKGGALYIAIIISVLISIVLTLFIVLAYYNTQSVQSNASLNQLQLSLESGFELSKSNYFSRDQQHKWFKLPYNNDSIRVKKLAWGCYELIDVEAKNRHQRIHKTGLFGGWATGDTALVTVEQNSPIGLAGNIEFKSNCYLPKAGVKTAYIEGTSFSQLNKLYHFIKSAPNTIPKLNETFLKNIQQTQSELNMQTDSLISFIPDNSKHSFKQKTLVIQQPSIFLSTQVLANNIKLIASNTISIDKTCQLENVLLIARKIVFKKGFKGIVHAIVKDSIVVEDECEFNYPSSFCCYHTNSLQSSNNNIISGIFFGTKCLFEGSLLATQAKNSTGKSMIKLNKDFQLIGSAYSSHYADVQGSIYGTVICQSLLLQTTSAVYENHLLNCTLDPKKYSRYLVVSNWLDSKQTNYACAKWF